MNKFSIRDIENLTRIKAHTLRIWEQRYALFRPKRLESQHRYYDAEDLKVLLRISHLYHSGYKISHIAAMDSDRLRNLALEKRSDSDNQSVYQNQLIESSIDFDTRSFETALQRAIAEHGFEGAMLNVVFPFMQKIGLLWLTGHVIPAQEHFASTLIMRQLLLHIDRLEKPANTSSRRILLFTPPGEMHEIPLLLMQYILKKNGHQTVYAGAGLGESALARFCYKESVTEIFFLLITNLTRYCMIDYLKHLQAALPGKPIYFNSHEEPEKPRLPANTCYLQNREAILAFARRPV